MLPGHSDDESGDPVTERSTRFGYGAAIWATAILLPLTVAGALLAVNDHFSWPLRIGVFLLGLALTLGLGYFAGRHAVDTLGTVSDLLGALRESDFSMRGRVHHGRDPLQALIADVNLLSDDLREGRRKRTETSRFLGKTLTALRDPVFVADEHDRLRLINPAARILIGAERSAAVGRDLVSLGLGEALAAPDNGVFNWHFPGGSGRWAVRRASWYSGGREHRLIMLRDLSAALGEEERRAWQRLIRVLSHELNNSLTPIGSLAGSLSVLVEEGGIPGVQSELRLGLEVIGRRAGSLARFLSGYGKLARLPPLQPRPFRLDIALSRLARLEGRLPIEVTTSESAVICGDEDQLSQAFINLLRNAVEATLPTAGGVRLSWRIEATHVRVVIEDDGVGLPPTDSLFVPFFTTKVDGSGIGLSLTRLIIDAHAGTVELSPRTDARGAVATVRLPFGT